MKCCVEVDRGMTRVAGVGFSSGCIREATIQRDGKWYCWQHDPLKVKEREEASREYSRLKSASRLRARQKYLEILSEEAQNETRR